MLRQLSPSADSSRALAPLLRSSAMTSVCPYLHARCSGVVGNAMASLPFTSSLSTLRRCWTSLSSPLSAARCNGSCGMSSKPGMRQSTILRKRITICLNSTRVSGAWRSPQMCSSVCRAARSGKRVSSLMPPALCPCMRRTSSSPASARRYTVYTSDSGMTSAVPPLTLYTRHAKSSSSGTVPRSIALYPSQNSVKLMSPWPSRSNALNSCFRSSRLDHPISFSMMS
mmetsp:Transcript_18180/g.45163  ORF Transcript_18180/g.45163 Transcript_18180/m.45163 type:complete len:227 (+) Transcript_18180:2546-3226(+)